MSKVGWLPLADGRRLLAVGRVTPRVVQLYDPASMELVGPPLDAADVITAFAAVPREDDRFSLVTGGLNDSVRGTVRLWTLAFPGSPVALSRYVGSVNALTGALVGDGTAWVVWGMRTERCVSGMRRRAVRSATRCGDIPVRCSRSRWPMR